MKGIEFGSNQATAMACFIAELTRQSIAYTVRQLVDGWRIEVTGF